jgi:hypothetical protein
VPRSCICKMELLNMDLAPSSKLFTAEYTEGSRSYATSPTRTEENAPGASNSGKSIGIVRNTRFGRATHLAFLVTKMTFANLWRTGRSLKSREKCGK